MWLLWFCPTSCSEPETKQRRGPVRFIFFHHTTGCTWPKQQLPLPTPLAPLNPLCCRLCPPCRPQPTADLDTPQGITLPPVWEETQKSSVLATCCPTVTVCTGRCPAGIQQVKSCLSGKQLWRGFAASSQHLLPPMPQQLTQFEWHRAQQLTSGPGENLLSRWM